MRPGTLTERLVYHPAIAVPGWGTALKMRLKWGCAALLAVMLAGCNVVYKLDIQQGNILDQEMIADVRPGMTKRQVELVLGSPALEDPFHQNRWDYIYTYSRRGNKPTKRNLTLFFEDDRLMRMEGDYLETDSKLLEDAKPDDVSSD